MVVLASGYYIDPFKIYQGVTQGDPISSKIFNVVVEAVIRRGGGVFGSGRISLRGQTDKKLTSMLVFHIFLSFELAGIF